MSKGMRGLRKIIAILICFSIIFALFACNTASVEAKVLFCFAKNSKDEFGGAIYSEAIKSAKEKKISYDVLELGVTEDKFTKEIEEAVTEAVYDYIIIIGDGAYRGLERFINTNQGRQFIALDCKLTSWEDNVYPVEFKPEVLGYLSGVTAAEQSTGKVGYVSQTLNSFDNQILYGFLQGAKSINQEIKVAPMYTEEQSNIVKSQAYADLIFEECDTLADGSGRGMLGSIESAKANDKKMLGVGLDLKTAAAELKSAEKLSVVSSSVCKDYTEAIKSIYRDILNKNDLSNVRELTMSDKAFKIVGDNSDMSLNDADVADFKADAFAEAVKNNIVSADKVYTPQYSVDIDYHEAVPRCNDTSNWKYHPRKGSNEGMKPLGWKAISVWATLYLQDKHKPVINTGLEFKNMKIFAYTTSKGWVLLEHANPTGSFYDEGFVNDANKEFKSNYLNISEQKLTRVKLDYSTLGYNYHPFGSHINLVDKGFVDSNGDVVNGEILYILSAMQIRLVTWDTSKPSDIDEAKYVANIGADWWREVGLNWTPDWNSNKDVCIGQFRTVTKEFKTLYMTNVPVQEYDAVFKDFDFNNLML